MMSPTHPSVTLTQYLVQNASQALWEAAGAFLPWSQIQSEVEVLGKPRPKHPWGKEAETYADSSGQPSTAKPSIKLFEEYAKN